MKKKLLLGALLVGSIFTAKAQDSCAEAVEVAEGITNVAAITGAYPAGDDIEICSFAEGDPEEALAAWYSFTPENNGIITVDAGVDSNLPTIDTRLRILSGSCDALACEATADDISYPADLRSRIVDLQVEAGTTYYIVFDNMWYDGGTAPAFDFEVIYTEVTCFAPASFMYSEDNPPTTTTVNIMWEAPELGSPESYEFEYGEEGFTQGEGEILTIEGLEAAVTDLEPGTTYAFYIRSICGEGDESEWVGPITFTTEFDAATLPYEYGFEADGGWGSAGGWTIATNAQVGADASYEGEGFAFSNTNNTTPSDSRLFTAPIALEAGQEVFITFYTTYLGNEGTSASLDLTVGTSTEDQEVVESFSIDASTEATITYGQEGTSWTPSETGVYVFSFHQNSPAIGAAPYSLLLDSVSFTATAGVNELLASQFSVYPNPANNVINISNADNILVNGVQIVDINGRVVKSVKLDNVTEAQINVADLSAGMYLMTISSDNGTTTKKIVKN